MIAQYKLQNQKRKQQIFRGVSEINEQKK